MPRRPNEKPTYIYWLFDARPEKLAMGWPFGEPFYCGKTVATVEKRKEEHRRDARRSPNRPVCRRVNECGEFVAVRLMATVSATGDWRAAEQKWIRQLRLRNPDCVNATGGGEGSPGYVHSPEARRKMSEMRKGRPLTPEHRIKIGRAQIGKKLSLEHRALISARRKGKSNTTGYKFSAESKAKMRAAKIGKPLSKEHLAKLVASRRRTYEMKKQHASGQ